MLSKYKQKYIDIILSDWPYLLGKVEFLGLKRYRKEKIMVVEYNEYFGDNTTPLACIGMRVGLDIPNMNYIILVNKKFCCYSKAEQNAILAHEIGHLALGHIEGTGNIQSTQSIIIDVRVISWEIAADLYACEKGYRTPMLNILAQYLQYSSTREEKTEILSRIKAVFNFGAKERETCTQ